MKFTHKDSFGVKWVKNGAYVCLEHPFHNILRVLKQVSEESLDILYGDNTFVAISEDGEDPFLSVFTKDIRDRINSKRWHLIGRDPYWCRRRSHRYQA